MRQFNRFVSPGAGPIPASLASGPHALHDHVVQFYHNDSALLTTVSTFLAEGLEADEPCVVIATREHARALRSRLTERGIDVNTAVRLGLLVFEDAHDLLARFMVGNAPNEELFKTGVSQILQLASAARPHKKLRAFGELVDVLWEEGKPAAALRLEELWNELARSYSFTLLCGYAMDRFPGVADSAGFEAICRQHGRIIHSGPDLQVMT